jgi:hypothetical protein
MRARTLTRMVLATLTVCLLAASPAAARPVRHVSFSFTPTGVTEPTYLAVEQATGAVYVTGANSKVEKFSASGEPERSFSSAVFEGEPEGVAVDNSGGTSKGDVYVADIGERKVVKLDSSGGEVAGFPPITASSIPLGHPGSEEFIPVGLAVDPSNGNLVVFDHGHGEIDIFSSSGVFISQFKAPNVDGITVGANDEIFTSGEGIAGAQAWSPADNYETPTPIGPRTTTHGIAADLSTKDLLVLGGEPRQVEEYEALGTHALLLQFGAGLIEFSRGMAVFEKEDTVYAINPELDSVKVFGAPAELAEVFTGTPATGVTSTSADVSGTVDPEGATVTGCSFEYGLSAAYGYTSPCSPVPPLTGNTAIPVTAGLERLQPGETYHYRLVGITAGGQAYGEDETLQTPPAPPTVSESVSALTQTSAILDASINPNNQETTYHFEYGPTTAYGTVLPAPDASIGSGYGNVVVGEELIGLQPGTTYHFRVVATNASSPPGGTPGPDQAFTTPPLQPPVVDTGQAVGVAQNTATLTGTVETQGFQTMYEFDIGTDTGYGTRIFGNAGAEPGTHTFTVTLQDLMPGTTYYYRIAATNTFGTTYGVDVTFTTSTYPSATLTAPVSEPFVPSLLLAPTPSTSSGAAKAASVKPAARAARHGRARKSGRGRPGRHKRSGGSIRAGDAHGANGGGGR